MFSHKILNTTRTAQKHALHLCEHVNDRRGKEMLMYICIAVHSNIPL